MKGKGKVLTRQTKGGKFRVQSFKGYISMYDRDWAKVDINKVPSIKTVVPGPKSKEYHDRASKYMKGYSSQVKLFPVAFESGKGSVLTDVDGNDYIDFSSGTYELP